MLHLSPEWPVDVMQRRQNETIREAVAKMVDKSASLLVVLSTDETPIGIVTLHDVVRLQSQVTDAM